LSLIVNTEVTMDRNSPPALQSPGPSLDRRTFLTIGASVGVAGLAGCSAIADYIAGFVLEDVNVLNGSEKEVSGSIEVVDSGGDGVLDETFELRPSEDSGTTTETTDGGDEENVPMSRYEDVFDGEGQYEVTIELDEDSAVDGVTTAEETVDVADTSEEHIFAFIGASESEEAISIGVVEGFSDLENLDES
jgi:hypothetical protein